MRILTSPSQEVIKKITLDGTLEVEAVYSKVNIK